MLIFRFRILLGTINAKPEKVQLITYACCVMHNLLIEKRPGQHLQDVVRVPVAPGAADDVSWQTGDTLAELVRLRGNTGNKLAKAQRNHMCDYYNSPLGAVPWQDKMLG